VSRPLILGSIGAVIGAAAIALTFFVDGDPPSETAAVLKPPAPSPGAGVPVSDTPRKKIIATRDEVSAAAPASALESAPAPASALASVPTSVPTSAPASAPASRRPSFDVVRINPRGDAVIAGRASPNAEVTVRDGKTEVGTVRADSRGEWVVIPKEPLAAGSRELTLSSRTRTGDAAQSRKNVVIVVPERKKAAAPTVGALAVLVPREGKGESVVIQKPRQAVAPGAGFSGDPAAKPLSVDAVDYDESGNVTISGSATAGERLHIYIENKFAGSGKADPQGRWRLVPGGALSPGLYTLRVDQVDKDGKVLGRAETQFTRAKPANSSSRQTVVFVEPGNSLWRIARRVYGSGVQYTVIFDANREQIRNPDLIYPGQVFFVPHVN
jgi:nucleoid-associated protein YgaU